MARISTPYRDVAVKSVGDIVTSRWNDRGLENEVLELWTSEVAGVQRAKIRSLKSGRERVASLYDLALVRQVTR